MVFFSPSTRGFYTAEIHGEAMPADVVRITPARHRQLLEAQAGGAEIIAGPNGPIARQAKSTLALERERAIGAVKRQARARILAIAPYWRQLNDSAAIAEGLLRYQKGKVLSADYFAALERRRAIDGLRAASDRLEALVAAMSAAELAVFDPGEDTHWSAADEG